MFLFTEKSTTPEEQDMIEVIINYKHPEFVTTDTVCFSDKNWKNDLSVFLEEFIKVSDSIVNMLSKKEHVSFELGLKLHKIDLLNFSIPLQVHKTEEDYHSLSKMRINKF